MWFIICFCYKVVVIFTIVIIKIIIIWCFTSLSAIPNFLAVIILVACLGLIEATFHE